MSSSSSSRSDRHGTTGEYRRGCHCDACRAAWNAYACQYARDYRASGRRTTSAQDARRHIRYLIKHGWSVRSIALAAGVSSGAISNLERGVSKRVTRRVEEAVLGIAMDERPKGTPVPARLVHRLIDAMVVAGIPKKRIYGACGVPSTRWHDSVVRSNWTTWRRVSTVYEHLARRGIVPADLLEELP